MGGDPPSTVYWGEGGNEDAGDSWAEWWWGFWGVGGDYTDAEKQNASVPRARIPPPARCGWGATLAATTWHVQLVHCVRRWRRRAGEAPRGSRGNVGATVPRRPRASPVAASLPNSRSTGTHRLAAALASCEGGHLPAAGEGAGLGRGQIAPRGAPTAREKSEEFGDEGSSKTRTPHPVTSRGLPGSATSSVWRVQSH